MTDVRSDKLTVYSESEISAVDGITTTVAAPPTSSFLGTMAEFLQKTLNHITTVSATLVPGDNASAVAFGGAPQGMFQGQPFSAASGGSATPGSMANTSAATIRKVLCTIALSNLPIASSLATTAPTLQFVYGSVYRATAATGNLPAFDDVPLPKPSGGEIAVGWLNIPNSWTSGDDLATTMFVNDKRGTQGFDLTQVLGDPAQP
jgi:hypothetical protein